MYTPWYPDDEAYEAYDNESSEDYDDEAFMDYCLSHPVSCVPTAATMEDDDLPF